MTEEKSQALNEPKHKAQLNAILITFVVVILAIFFGIQLIMKTGVFHQPGEILFSESTTEENRDFVNGNLGDIAALNLQGNIEISATETTSLLDGLSRPEKDQDFSRLVLYDILLPVADFNSSQIVTSFDDARNAELISVWNLTPSHRLLGLVQDVDNYTIYDYYLDSFNRGGFFQYLKISGAYQEDVNRIADMLQENIAAFPTKDTVLTFAQTGVTALSRRMNSKLDQVGDATYFSENIGDLLSSFDLTHTSNEASFSNQANGSNICSKPEMVNTLTSIGLDIVELTGNHNQDCGDEDAIKTIEQYHDLGIQTFGGGISAEQASQPLQIDKKDTHITLLGYNLSTGGYTLDNTPGANFYTPEKAQADITTAKDRGDFIIVDIQYYECNNYVHTTENTTCDYANSAEGDQIGFFRSLIDMGADLVIGTAAHQPQTFEQYHDGAIYYGLGNLFFDQSTWPGTTRSLILVHYFWQGNLIQTRIIPTIYDSNFQTKIMDPVEAAKFIARLIIAQPQAQPSSTQSNQTSAASGSTAKSPQNSPETSTQE